MSKTSTVTQNWQHKKLASTETASLLQLTLTNGHTHANSYT